MLPDTTPNFQQTTSNELIDQIVDQIGYGMQIVPILGDDLLYVKEKKGSGEYQEINLLSKLATDIAMKYRKFINLAENRNKGDELNFVYHILNKQRINIYTEIREVILLS